MRLSSLSIIPTIALFSLILTAASAPASAQEITDARKKKEIVTHARTLLIDEGAIGNFSCDIRSRWFGRAWDSIWSVAQPPESLAVPPCMTITMHTAGRSDASLQNSPSPEMSDETLAKSLYDRYRVLRQVIEIADISWRSPEEILLPGTESYRVTRTRNGYRIDLTQGSETLSATLGADFMVRSATVRLKKGGELLITPSLSRRGAHARVDSMRVELTEHGARSASMTIAFTYGSVAGRREGVSSIRVVADHVMRIMQRRDPDFPIDDVITYENYQLME